MRACGEEQVWHDRWGLTVSTTMMTAEPTVARGAHYTALVETIDHQGATKRNAKEREQLLKAADVLLFGEPTASGRSGGPRF